MNSRLRLAISEFSKGRWAAEPSDEPPVHATEPNLTTKVLSWLGKLARTEPNLTTKVLSWLGKLAPLAFARYLITFFIGATAVLAWQSNRDVTREEMIATPPTNLDLLRQSIDKLAAEIVKVEAAEQDILDKISTAQSHPAAAAVRNSVPRSSQARP